jgi:uncharacterized membrane protein YjjP (DUF1212 family)
MIIPKEIKQKPLEYLLLALVFLVGLVVYFFIPISSHGQRLVVYFMAASYFLWSIIHHYRRGDLNLSIVVEYLVMALVGIVLLSVSLF